MHEDVLSPEERANLRMAHESLVAFYRLLAVGQMLEASRAYGRSNQLLLGILRCHTEFSIDNSEVDPNHQPLPPGNAVSRLIRCLGGSWAWFEMRMIVVERNNLDWDKKAGRLAHASNRLYQSEMRTDPDFEPERWKLFDACVRFEKSEASPDENFWHDLQALTVRAIEQIAGGCEKQLRDGSNPDDVHWNDCFRQIIETCRETAT
jgi:hypothetical protein